MANHKITIYHDGTILTMDADSPQVEALAVMDGRIVATGSLKDVKQAVGDGADLVSLEGGTLLPGFIDGHSHFCSGGMNRLYAADCAVENMEALKESLRRKLHDDRPSQWVVGHSFDEKGMEEQCYPTREILDEVSTDVPIFFRHVTGHTGIANSKALEMAGITKDTPDPQGGQIDRDENGEPTGVLRESARNLVTPLIPETTEEQKVDLVVDLGKLLASQGITATCDMGNLDPSDSYDTYMAAVKKGFCQKVGVYYMWEFFADDPKFQIPESRFDRSQQIFAAGLKLIGDGSVSGRTAWMNEPYLDSDECGFPVCSDELMESAIAYCKEHHCQLSMHAMGGHAIDRIVDRVYPEEKWTEGDVPHLRMEHWTEPSESAIRKSAEKGLAVATQPIFLYAEIESYLTNLGVERMKKTYPIQDLLKAGVPFCFSTDAPATSWAVPSDPFPCLKGGVTRTAWDGTDCGPDNRVDVETAIQLYTREGARVAGIPEIGELKAGYHADFITLSEDILSVDPMKIDQVYVTATYVDGEKVYESEAKS